MMDFIKENAHYAIPVVIFLVGWLLPPLKFNALGKIARDKIGNDMSNLIAKRLDALEKGLLDLDVDGNSNLVSNDDISKELKKVKIDLGLVD